MIRHITDGVSIVLILTGAYLLDLGLLLMVVGVAGLFVANRLERTAK